jgi:hypothetical protein
MLMAWSFRETIFVRSGKWSVARFPARDGSDVAVLQVYRRGLIPFGHAVAGAELGGEGGVRNETAPPGHAGLLAGGRRRSPPQLPAETSMFIRHGIFPRGSSDAGDAVEVGHARGSTNRQSR